MYQFVVDTPINSGQVEQEKSRQGFHGLLLNAKVPIPTSGFTLCEAA